MFARASFWAVVFAAASGLDLLLTWVVLSDSELAYEANPLAASILHEYGWWGLSAFKAAAVVFVTSIGLAINRKYPRSALRMFRISSVLVLCVLAYSMLLLGPWSESENYGELAEARHLGKALERKHEGLLRYMKHLDELIHALLANHLTLREATASLHDSLEELDYDPLPDLHRGLGASFSDEACLAAHLVRGVGFLVQNDPVLREQTKAPGRRVRQLRYAAAGVFLRTLRNGNRQLTVSEGRHPRADNEVRIGMG